MANPFRDYLELRNNSGAAFGVGVTEHSLNNVMQRATERNPGDWPLPSRRLIYVLDGRAALSDDGAVVRQLRVTHAVLGFQVVAGICAFAGHRGVELERLEVDLDRYLGADSFQCALQGVQAHSAPGAGHVGNKVDAHR